MSECFEKIKSVCPVCLKTIDACKAVGPDGLIYMEKTCPEHGAFQTLLWEGDLDSYRAWNRVPAGKVTPVGASPVKNGCPHDCGLCEDHERDGCCVLLELTNRCNLSCPVCFASAGEQTPHDLSLAEISAQYDMLMQRGGPFNIQLSGGEPTMRDDLPEIIALGKEKGFSFFQLNTNGLRLAREEGYAELLARSGISCVFLQFDGLEDEIYRVLRGRPLKKLKLKAIERCQKAGLPVVLVPTVAPGVNDHALGEILKFAISQIPYIRGVHIQPISYFGRCGLTAPKMRLTIPRVLSLLEKQTDGLCKSSDFGGGGAESPYCSFHASYLRKDDGSLKSLPRRQSQCSCIQSSDARQFVARQWGQKPQDVDCCCEETAAEDCCCESPEMSDISCCEVMADDGCTNSCCCEVTTDDLCTDSCCYEDSTDNCCADACCCENSADDCCADSCCCDDSTDDCCVDSCCCEDTADDCCADSCCCEDTNDDDCTSSVSDCCDTSSLDAFLKKAEENTFTVSGMLFQDAWNLDLDRLRRCYICEADSEHGMVPFCAYNLTDINGKALYRK